jgi:hypothetical protein
MSCRPVLVDLPKDRGPYDGSLCRANRTESRASTQTSPAKDNSVPGRRQTAMLTSSDAREPPSARAKIAGSQLVANLRGSRFDVVKAEVTHFVELPYWEKPLSQFELTLFSVLLHQPSGVELVRSESFDRLVEKINASLRIAGEHHE